VSGLLQDPPRQNDKHLADGEHERRAIVGPLWMGEDRRQPVNTEGGATEQPHQVVANPNSLHPWVFLWLLIHVFVIDHEVFFFTEERSHDARADCGSSKARTRIEKAIVRTSMFFTAYRHD
jgi:hypothetical protein